MGSTVSASELGSAMAHKPDSPKADEVGRSSPCVRHVVVDENSAGQRLDNFLQREAKGVPRTRIYRALRKGEVRVNKGRTRADYRLAEGDTVRLPPMHTVDRAAPAKAPAKLEDQLASRIVYEDADLLVVNKPSGLAVHGGSGLRFGLIEALRQMRPQARYLELVHRLDRDTSGLILIAKRAATLRELHRQLREKHIDKRYLAMVAGRWPAAQRFVDAPLLKNVLQSGERMVRVAQEGKRAQTHFQVVQRLRGATLIEAQPVTGRTHQIRVHARHAGFPLLGDDKYESEKSSQVTQDIGLKRLFLHAASLEFTLPDKPTLRLEAALDDDLQALVEKLDN